jgi:PKD repeat protein
MTARAAIAAGLALAAALLAPAAWQDHAAPVPAPLPAPAPAPVPVPVIRAIETTGMAPFALHVHATESVPAAGSLITARLAWDFGDEGAPHNRLVGFNAAHLYRRPGAYTVTLTMTDEAGRSDAARLEVRVTPDQRMPIYVSPAGDDRNRGREPHSAVRSLARAGQLLRHGMAILLQRGATFAVQEGLRVERRDVLIGAWGEGEAPVLRWEGAAETTAAMIHLTPDARRVVIEDLAFESPHPPRRTLVRGVNVAGRNLAVRGCRFRNVSYALRAAEDPVGFLSQDNQAEILGAYYVWGQGSDHSHLGNRVAGSADEHNMRFLAERVLIAGNELTNRAKRTIWCLDGRHVSIVGNRLSHGPLMIGPRPEDEGAWAWALIEGNELEHCPLILRHGSSHVMVTSNLIRWDGGTAIDVWGWSAERRRTCDDVRLVHNTVINLDAAGRCVSIGPATADTLVANNLYFAPALVSGRSGSCNVSILDPEPGSVRLSHNLWAEPVAAGWGEGWNYLGGKPFTAEGFLTPADWARRLQAEGEVYRRFQPGDLDDALAPRFDARVSQAVAGAHADLRGRPRPLRGTVTAGAVER